MRQAIIAIVILFTGIIVKSQEPNTLYFMDRVPQASMMNPAFVPKCNFYFGIPASNFHTNINFAPLKFNTIFPYDNVDKTVGIFMRNDNTKASFLNALSSNNELYTDFQNDILIFGFRIKEWYFHFNASARSTFSFAYPKSFVETLLINGFELNTMYDYSKLGLSGNSYAEFGFGMTRQINEFWTVGAKMKVLRGIANVRTNNNQFSIGTVDENDLYVLRVKSDFSVDMTIPYYKVNKGENLSMDSLIEKDDDYKIKPFENMGFAIDLGATYSGIENLVLSASVIDLGSISWKDNVSNMKLSSNFEFDGADFVADSFDNAFDDSFEALKDSFKFSSSSNVSYSTALPTKIYIGGEYSFVKFFSVGLLSSSRIYQGEFSEQLTFSGNLKPAKMAMLSLSYSIIDNAAHTLGMGFSFRIPPTQFYFVWDNIPVYYGKYFVPYKMDRINFRFGMNWVFGCNGREKKLKDKPMGWE